MFQGFNKIPRLISFEKFLGLGGRVRKERGGEGMRKGERLPPPLPLPLPQRQKDVS
jgi:hypothetical protein